MLTTPITTPHFHSRVLALLSTSLSEQSRSVNGDVTQTKNASPIRISPLSPADTPLTSEDSISQLIGITSSWIDLGSPDPIIADVSRQVLKLEVTYAAFCGISYLIIPGPRLRNYGPSDSGVIQFGRAVLDSLGQGPYMQIYIWLPMLYHPLDDVEEMGDLAPFTRQQFLDDEEVDNKVMDLFGTWEAWNTIRTMCTYSTRLCVGKETSYTPRSHRLPCDPA